MESLRDHFSDYHTSPVQNFLFSDDTHPDYLGGQKMILFGTFIPFPDRSVWDPVIQR